MAIDVACKLRICHIRPVGLIKAWGIFQHAFIDVENKLLV
jgi:hypothetical protein